MSAITAHGLRRQAPLTAEEPPELLNQRVHRLGHEPPSTTIFSSHDLLLVQEQVQTRTAPITPDEGSDYAACTTPLTGLTSSNTAHAA